MLSETTTEPTGHRDDASAADVPARKHLGDAEPLWAAYRATENAAIRNALVERYLPIVRYNAERIWSRLPEGTELDDLVSAGVFGLMDAVDAFDPDRGVKFETYCVPRVRGAIIDELRRMDWVPRLVRSKAAKLRDAIDRGVALFGREPTDEELEELLDAERPDVEKLRRESRAATLSSLSAVRFETDSDKDVTEESLLADPRVASPGDNEDVRDFWRAILQGLDRQERLVMIMYYVEKMTMKEIGEQLDLSESRVSQMHGRIVFGVLPVRLNAHRARESFLGILSRERS